MKHLFPRGFCFLSRLLLLFVLLCGPSSAQAGIDGASVVAEISRRGDAAVASYDPAKRLVTAAELSSIYFDLFENMELDLGIRSPRLKAELEVLFGLVNGKAMRGLPPSEINQSWQALRGKLHEAAALYEQADDEGFMSVFIKSMLILLREATEAMLVVGALAAYLRRAGGADRLWVIYAGVGSAIPFSLLTGWALTGLLQAAGASRAVMEGVTMILAASVLCCVSFWLFSKSEAKRWQAWIAGQIDSALSQGSLLTLGGASFLAVYREGAETVLFYHALAVGSPGQAPAIVAGIMTASLVLLAGFFVFRLVAMRVPYHTFFGATAVLLYGLSIVFMGQGISELQAAGHLGSFHLPGIPQISWLGIAPTLQGTATQGAMLLLPLLAWGWLKWRPIPTTRGVSLT